MGGIASGPLFAALSGVASTTQEGAIKGGATLCFSATRKELKSLAVDQGGLALLGEAGREGIFAFNKADYSAAVDADAAEGIFLRSDHVPPTDGAWVRIFQGAADVRWFGAAGDGVHDDYDALQGALDVAGDIGLGRGTYLVSRALEIRNAGQVVIGDGGAAEAKQFGAVIRATEPMPALLRVLGHSVRLSGIELDGDQKSEVTLDFVRGAYHCLVERMSIHGGTVFSFRCRANRLNWYSNNVRGTGEAAVQIRSTDLQMIGGRIVSSGRRIADIEGSNLEIGGALHCTGNRLAQVGVTLKGSRIRALGLTIDAVGAGPMLRLSSDQATNCIQPFVIGTFFNLKNIMQEDASFPCIEIDNSAGGFVSGAMIFAQMNNTSREKKWNYLFKCPEDGKDPQSHTLIGYGSGFESVCNKELANCQVFDRDKDVMKVENFPSGPSNANGIGIRVESGEFSIDPGKTESRIFFVDGVDIGDHLLGFSTIEPLAEGLIVQSYRVIGKGEIKVNFLNPTDHRIQVPRNTYLLVRWSRFLGQ